MTGQQRPNAGFTLLEMLVVLVVLGFLIVGLNRGLAVGFQLWSRQTHTLDAVGELDAVDRTLRGLIEQMDPGGRIETADIEGNSRSLHFVTQMPAAASALATRRAEVRLGVDRAHRLMLRWAPSPHVQPLVVAQPADTVLLNQVDHIEISYRSAAAGAAWENQWDSPIPPMLVRIHIAFAASDPRRWPDIVAVTMRERGG
jgi:general secretion pathway protein J